MHCSRGLQCLCLREVNHWIIIWLHVPAYAMPLFLVDVLGLPGNIVVIMELTIVVSFGGFASFHSVPGGQVWGTGAFQMHLPLCCWYGWLASTSSWTVPKFSVCLILISVKGDFHVISKYLVNSKEVERWWGKFLSLEGLVEFCCETIDWLKSDQSTERDWLKYVLSPRVSFCSSLIFPLPKLNNGKSMFETFYFSHFTIIKVAE